MHEITSPWAPVGANKVTNTRTHIQDLDSLGPCWSQKYIFLKASLS